MTYNTVFTFLRAMSYSTVLMVLICGAIVFLYWKYRKTSIAQTSLPTLLTVLGILGTFIGIFIGLLSFNTQNIQASVPILLEGLKLAFITSIFGMGFSFLLKFEGIVWKSKLPATTEYTGATIDTLAELLGKIQETQETIWSKAEKQLQGIEKSIVGEGDTTLLTQLQKLRTTLVDKQDELIKEFREFARTMAENNSKALIEALKEVIRDFNTKINEQFGDNFKQLNEAVGKILIWQEQYRGQIEQMTAQFDRSVKGIGEVKLSLSEIANRADSIVQASEKLSSILEATDAKQKDLERFLKEFAKIAEDARQVIPVINDHLIQATNKITQSLNDTSEQIKNSTDLNIEFIKSQAKVLTDNAAQVNTSVDRTMTDVSRNIERLIEESGRVLQEQVTRLDRSLQEELTKSLQSLGTQLTTLSGTFVKDYQPLTDSLRNVLTMAKEIGNAR